jgi:hypothetical protein
MTEPETIIGAVNEEDEISILADLRGLRPVSPLSPESEACFVAAIKIAESSKKLRDSVLRSQAEELSSALLKQPVKEIHQNFKLREILRPILADAEVQKSIRGVRDEDQLSRIIVEAAARAGEQIDNRAVSQLLAALTCTQRHLLSEDELLWVSGGVEMMMSQTPHTNVCPHCLPDAGN